MDIDSLYKKFLSAKNSDEISECIIKTLKLLENFSEEIPNELKEIYGRLEILIYQSMKMLQQKNNEEAQFIVYLLVKTLRGVPKDYFIFYYLLGKTNYALKDYERAGKCFTAYNELRMKLWNDVDELSFFYLANSLAIQGRYKESEILYEKILELKSDFPEVKNNIEIVKRNSNENLILEVSCLWNFCDWQDIPIFINSRDRVGVLKKLVDWLLDAGYHNLIILDNNSTYPKLMEYYSDLEKDSRIKIILLKKNLGYKAIWDSKILETLKISTPYIYTDPDVVPAENCPKDFVKHLIKILDNNHEIRKVGLGLIYDDVTFYDKEVTYDRENYFCKNGSIGDNLSYCALDTTFALYSNLRSYSLRFSLRTYGNFVARHLPWYFDYDNLPEDEKYYMEHAEKKFVTSVKAKITNGE